jgi:hypothetical protein
MSTQIRGNKQIKNITIENDQLVNGTVELNKLAEGAELIKRDGSVAFTGTIDAGQHKIINAAPGVDPSDVVTKAQLDAVDEKVGGTLVNRESVSGVKDGENVTFTLANEPSLSTEQIFLNGSLLNAGANADYVISGSIITFTIPPQSGDIILANYVVDAIQLNVDVQATINQLNGRLTTAEGELFTAQGDISDISADVVALDGRVDTAETDIIALEVRATNLETNVDAVEADIAAEESRAMAAESGLDSRLDAVEFDVLSTSNRVTAVEGDITSLESADVDMDGRVSDLEDGLQAETTARSSALSSLTSRVVALEADDSAVDGRLDVLETDVSVLQTDLIAEETARIAADGTLQANINAEIANRAAAVSGVQTNLNTEISDRIADVAAEETRALAAEADLVADISAEEVRAMAAEAALDARIDVLEADPVSQAYVDQKIADLVNSAPAVLDTLKELSDALGGDENFAASVAADIAAVDARVDTLVGDLAQEAIDRAADVDAEESRAMAAEGVLDGRLDVVEADIVSLQTDVAAKADSASLATVATSGSYADLINKPSLFSGSYNDLSNKPTLFSGAYADLSGKPILATVATSGSYNDLIDKPSIPSLSGYATESYVDTAVAGKADSSSLATIALTGDYADLVNKPSLFSGSYNDLSDKPSLFSGDYNDLSSKPVLFSGSYIDLSDKPSLFSGSYVDLTNKPSFADVATSGDYADLINKPAIPSLTGYATESYVDTAVAGKADSSSLATVATSGSYNDLLNLPSLFSGSYNDLSNKPTLFSGAYADLSGKPSLFSGDYNDLSNKPVIPSLTGYATESYVDSAVSGLVNGAPAVLDTLKELSDALGADENFATTVAGQIGDVAGDVSALDLRVTAAEGDISDLQTDVAAKADSASLATVATSGSYSDLTGAPSLATVATSGSYNDLTNKPSLFSGSYNDLSDKPSIPDLSGDITVNSTVVVGKGTGNHAENVVLGGNTLTSNDTSWGGVWGKNVAIGRYAGGSMSYSTAVGWLALGNCVQNEGEGHNVAIGHRGLQDLTTGTRNVHVGSMDNGTDGSGVTTGFENISIGATARVGSEVIKSIAIGAYSWATGSQAVAIGHSASAAADCLDIRFGGSTKISGDSSGNITFVGNISSPTITSIESDIAAKADSASLADVATSGSYNDLSDKPSIPSLTGYATESYVDSAVAGKADSSSLAAVATSGDYVDLINKPTIYTPVKEVPAGLIDGSNVTFTLSDAPAVAGTEQVFLNGLLQFAGASDDYTISGDTITFNTAPDAGWKLVVFYFV